MFNKRQFLCFLFSFFMNYAVAFSPATVPLFLTGSSIPNVVLMLDDSGSMDWEILTIPHYDFCYYKYSNCGTLRTNGLIRPDATSNYWQYAYIYGNDNVYSNGGDFRYLSDYSNINDYSPSDDDSVDWRVLSSDFNVIYYNPNVVYKPWPGYADASFTAARGHPEPSQVAHTTLTDLTNATYIIPQDSAGFTPPTFDGDSPTYNTTPNGLIDGWDDHTVYKIGISSVQVWEISYTSSGSNVTRENRSASTITDADEVARIQTNFANWYQYHRRRAFVMNSAIGDLLEANPSYRYAMGLINQSSLLSSVPSNNNNLPSHTTSLLSSLYSHQQQANGTPLRNGLDRAGRYLSSSTVTPVPIENKCQQNFSILFTDGYWNGSFSNSAINDVDGDSYSGTVADIARYYYNTDLRSDLDDAVPVSNQDTNRFQHMNTFTVAFGVRGSLTDSNNDGWPDNAGVNLTESSDWGNPFVADTPEKIDDLWHAAFNSKALFNSAQSPQDLVTGLSDALAEIDRRSGSAAAVAANSSNLRTNSKLFQSRFNSASWTGDLYSISLDSNGNPVAIPDWKASTQIASQSPSSRIIIAGNQSGNSVVGSAFTSSALSDEYKGILTNAMDTMGIRGSVGDFHSALINFLRGSATNEGSSGAQNSWTQCATSGNDCTVAAAPGVTVRYGNGSQYMYAIKSGTFTCNASEFGSLVIPGDSVCDYATTNSYGFRQRTSKLGDFLDSRPVYVGKPDQRITDTAYETFKTNNASRTAMVYVGGNDGMLHGFEASTGNEKLAYVPFTAAGSLYKLAQQGYTHSLYVNGDISVGDVCTGSPCAWKTLLVGTMRGGGKGIFALDVTDPSRFTEDRASSIFAWEYVQQIGTSEEDTDLGYSYSKPLIAKLNNGNWGVILGNGYGSSDGEAVLYILDAATGAPLTTGGKLMTGVGTATDKNGLSSPTAVDTDNDGDVDIVYAGDLKGNLWKFDISSSSPANWGVAYTSGDTKLPLFSSGTSKPITTPPEVGLHPERNGYMVYFGTGKYLEAADNQNTGQSTQSFFGIWDQELRDSAFTASITSSSLLSQTILQELTVYPNDTNNDGMHNNLDVGKKLRFTSRNAICWHDCGIDVDAHLGWKIDLELNSVNNGEKQVSRSQLRNGKIIFTTIQPSPSVCDRGGKSFLMELNAADGSFLNELPFDINDDGEINDQDGNLQTMTTADLTTLCLHGCPAPGGFEIDEIVNEPTILDCKPGMECKYLSGSTGNISKVNENSGNKSLGRQSWRIIRSQ